MRVLLVEDDDDLAEVVATALRGERVVVDCASTFSAALENLLVTSYDLAVFDRGLPDGDGLELCRMVRSDPSLQQPKRVLVLTARDAVADRIGGLDAGADDYLVKPFDLAELLARVRALARRADQVGDVLHVGDLEVDVAHHRARRGNRDLGLTAKEFTVLSFFARHPDEVLSAETLLEHCWDANADPFTTSVRVILSRLRAKIGDPALIQTVAGVGYRLGAAP